MSVPQRPACFEELASWPNLLSAYRRAAVGKRGGAEVAAFEHRLEENLLELAEELRSGCYAPGPYRSFEIREPKRRLISAAPFRDRVVHHALHAVMEPPFERSFIRDSYANRSGKGTHRALERAEYYARRHRYVLSVDVRQFFPSIDHAILLGVLGKTIRDGRVLDLASRILAGGDRVLANEYDLVYFPGDDLLAALRPRGLPIGNLTSQFWANVYLNPFDHFVKRELRVRAYVRYVDDILFFHDGKEVLWDWKNRVERRLSRLRLTIHAGSHPRPVDEGIPFLGWLLWPHRRRLKGRKVVEARRRLLRCAGEVAKGQRARDDLDLKWLGWVNHARFGTTTGIRRSMGRAVHERLHRPDST